MDSIYITPWAIGALAYSQIEFLPVLQVVSLAAIAGLNFLICLVNISLAPWWIRGGIKLWFVVTGLLFNSSDRLWVSQADHRGGE